MWCYTAYIFDTYWADSSFFSSARKLKVKFQCSTDPIDIGVLILPVAHVEGDDCDSDILRCLLVDVGQLQPRVVLLLPRSKSFVGTEWRIWNKSVNNCII